MKRALALVALTAALTACSQSSQSTGSSSPAPQSTNPIAFPLYAESTIVASRAWKQKTGSNSYTGIEVIAETPATLAQLRDWIHGVSSTPPSGFSVAASGSGVEQARTRAEAVGVEFQVFSHEDNGKHRSLIVVAMDPQLLDEKAGAALSLIGKYKMLPQSFRDLIDAQVKSRIGFTASEALDSNTPIGAAIAAVDQLRASGERGVVLVDGTRE